MAGICRVCLCSDKRMYIITKSLLQDIWERLTKIEFNIDDGKPNLVCYVCCAHLKKSHELMKRATKAEESLTALIHNGFVLSQKSVPLMSNLVRELDYNYVTKQLDCNEYKQTEGNTIEEMEEKNEEKDESNAEMKLVHVKIEREDNEYEDKDNYQFREENAVKEEGNFIYFKQEKEDSSESSQVGSVEVEVKTEICSDGNEQFRTQSPENILGKVEVVLEEVVEVFKTRSKNAEKCKNYRERKKKAAQKIKKSTKTTAERSRMYRMRRKQLSQGSELSANEVLDTPSTSNSQMTFVPSPQPFAIGSSTRKRKLKELPQKVKLMKLKDAIDDIKPFLSAAAPSTSSNRGNEEKTSISNKKGSGNEFSCHFCPYKCNKKDRYEVHIRKHTGEKPFVCDLCDFKCSDKHYLKVHKRYKHTKERKLSCQLCEYKCITNNDLALHLRTHTGEKPYVCNVCDYRCSDKHYLKKHMQYKHTKEKNYSCHLCQYTCVEKSSLNFHLFKHSYEKPYVCDICNYGCSRKHNLIRHIQCKHTMEKNFACHLCQYKCVTNNRLIVHLRTHTGEKPFECELCDYRCAQKAHLKDHVRIKHTKSKDYACYLCDFKFFRKCDLTTHFRTHTGEKPYICELCDYRCSQKTHLKDHIRYKHTKEKNYSCHLCDFKFVRKGDLNRHTLRKHTGQK